MKNKKIIILLTILFCITGCSKQLKDADNKIVKDETTGQTLTSNILCKPSNNLYNKYISINNEKKESFKNNYKTGNLSKNEYNKKIKEIKEYENYIKKLPKCTDFKINSGKYEGIWTSIFVKPLTYLIILLGKIVKNYGFAVIITTLLIRLVLCPITLKTAKQSENMKKAQPELNKLEKKYKDNKDQQATVMKSQEMMAIYKKYKINPMAGCIFGIIQIPLFFAFYEALYRIPAIFEDKMIGFELATTPWIGASNGNYLYLILPILVLVVTYVSFKSNNVSATGNSQEKQMKLMLNVMTIVIFFTSFTMSTAIVLYWITNSSFTIIQNLLVKRGNKND